MKTIELLELDVNAKTEKKGKLTYLSWAWAWSEFIKVYPEAKYNVKKNENGVPIFGDKTMGFMVYTDVTVGELTHEMWLPVMDHKNKAIMEPNMFDVNKTIMRCLTKNLAMFGLGLYIYAGEDLPEVIDETLDQNKLNALESRLKDKGKTMDALLAHMKLEKIETFEQWQKAMRVLG